MVKDAAVAIEASWRADLEMRLGTNVIGSLELDDFQTKRRRAEKLAFAGWECEKITDGDSGRAEISVQELVMLLKLHLSADNDQSEEDVDLYCLNYLPTIPEADADVEAEAEAEVEVEVEVEEVEEEEQGAAIGACFAAPRRPIAKAASRQPAEMLASKKVFISEGFICPCCKCDLGHLQQLQEHFQVCASKSQQSRVRTMQRQESNAKSGAQQPAELLRHLHNMSFWDRMQLVWALGVVELSEAEFKRGPFRKGHTPLQSGTVSAVQGAVRGVMLGKQKVVAANAPCMLNAGSVSHEP